jgi:hypothetical protein
MTAYVDYNFYTVTYGGVVVPETDFMRIALKATAKIAEITRGNADPDNATTGEAVKLATCAVCDLICRTEANNGRLVASESMSGDYSASYADNASLQTAIRNEVVPWLANTGLLFTGL